MELRDSIVGAWRTSSRTTAFLIESLPPGLWDAALPEIPTRTVRSVGAHLHNSRSSWIKTLGKEHGIRTPDLVDRRGVTQGQLLAALPKSAEGIEAILELGLRHGGQIPGSKRYVWRNLPLDIGHVLSYFVAHEGHHRGQLVLAARQLRQRLPASATNGLWQWTTRSREANTSL